MNDWLLSARCKGMDTSLFFPGIGEKVKEKQAISVCEECEVRRQCRDEAMREERMSWRFGIRGGLTPEARQRLSRRKRRIAA